MLGGIDGDGVEGVMRCALEASVFDLLTTADSTSYYRGCTLISDRIPAASLPKDVTLVLDDASRPFDFGRQLTTVIESFDTDRFVYVGAGAGPLLGDSELIDLAESLGVSDRVCVTNNYYSADLFAVRPADLLSKLERWPTSDNGVPRMLKEQFDVEINELPRTTSTQLNIDSPIDLVALSLTEAGGPRLNEYLRTWKPDTDRLLEAAQKLTDHQAEILVAGRASSRAWQYLEKETACRVRVLAEERGMTVAGRAADGQARSMLGQLIEAVGPKRCFEELVPDLCDAAFVDLRPALAHLGIQASRSDRFAADLGQLESIEHPEFREIIDAVNASPIPVVVGGHSLVSGVLMLLNDWVWMERDLLL